MSATDPIALKHAMSAGLMSFPVTDFNQEGGFNEAGYRARLEWLMSYAPAGLFAAGGTGEFFSLTLAEYPSVIRAASAACRGEVPVIAGVGGGTHTAIEFARAAQDAGADGLLILPHYLVEADQQGLYAHVQAICHSVALGVIVYNRGVCRLHANTLAQLADACPNLIGFKDGIGDIELMMSVRHRLGDRVAYLGGLPTAEVYAQAYRAMGTPTYSSAVFNFVPRAARQFYDALHADDDATLNRLLQRFFLPYVELRNRRAGYAVSIIKAGARLVGHDAGPVRPPLTDLHPEEEAMLAELIAGLGPQ